MKISVIISIGIASMLLAGCIHTDKVTKSTTMSNGFPAAKITPIIANKQIGVLMASCSGTEDQRLAAADSLMETIIESHAAPSGTVEFSEQDNAFKAGKQLYNLISRFYKNDISVSECQEHTNNIKNSLLSAV